MPRIDNEVLLRDFGIDILLAEAHLLVKSGSATSKRNSDGFEEPPPKRQLPAPPSASSAKYPADGQAAGKGSGYQAKPDVPGKAMLQGKLAAFIPGKSPDQIQSFLDEHFQREVDKKAMSQIMGSVYRNCLLAGRGFVKHGLARCRAVGNSCHIKCSKCLALGHSRTHWLEDCQS